MSLSPTSQTSLSGRNFVISGSGSNGLGALQVNPSSGTAGVSLSGNISGSGGVTIAGGVNNLSGANTYTGATIVTAGTLQAGVATVGGATPSSGAFGVNSPVTVMGGATRWT